MARTSATNKELTMHVLSYVVEWFARRLVDIQFGRGSVESDIVSDYLDCDPPDWSGAFRAWRTFARLRRDAAARKSR